MRTSFRFFSKSVLASAGLTALLTLSACGGGGDDNGTDPGPAQASSSECWGPLEGHFAIKERVSGVRTATSESEITWGEKVDFNGRAVRRNTEVRTTAYSAPAELAGLTSTDVIQDYFTVDEALAITRYAYGEFAIWSNSPRTYTEVSVYDPPADNPMYQLMPGQTTEITDVGSRRTENWDGSVTTERVNTTKRITYHGQETVSVPAGSFTACKFTFTTISGATNSDPSEATSWVGKGNGLPLKSQSDSPEGRGGGLLIYELTEVRQL